MQRHVTLERINQKKITRRDMIHTGDLSEMCWFYTLSGIASKNGL